MSLGDYRFEWVTDMTEENFVGFLLALFTWIKVRLPVLHTRDIFFLMRHLTSAQIRLVETLHSKTPIQIVNILSFKDKGTV